MGGLVPALLALITIPLYLPTIGTDRFGALSLIWVITGSLGFFDFGLTRAMAFRIASLWDEAAEARGNTMGTGFVIALLASLFAAVTAWTIFDIYFGLFFASSESIKLELTHSGVLVAILMPLVLLVSFFSGALQGGGRFLEVNIIAAAASIATIAAPLAAAHISGSSFPVLILAIIASRCVVLAYAAVQAMRHVAPLHLWRFCRPETGRLIQFGRWVMVSSILAPGIMYADRLMIGAFLGGHAVALYNMPFQLAQRISLIPTAISGAMYPKMVAAGRAEATRLCEAGTTATLAILTAPTIFAILIMPIFLELWLGSTLAKEGGALAQVILAAFWFNSLGVTYFSSLEAQGRPVIISIILVVEGPLYIFSQYFVLKYSGIEMVSFAFLVRSAVDSYLLYRFSGVRTRQLGKIGLSAVAILLTLMSVQRWPFPNAVGILVSALMLIYPAWMGLSFLREWGERFLSARRGKG